MTGGGGTVGVSEYPLGSDARELQRLDLQGRLLEPATRTILTAADIRPGMRVLDLGAGTGDMAFAVADLVGSSGEVIGIERSPEACAKAGQRGRDWRRDAARPALRRTRGG
jgi:protein-L-isoaspartate O-methyltransferase